MSAESQALANCGETDARIIVLGLKTYLALAIGDAGIGWAWNDDPRLASRVAFDQCKIRTTKPRLEVLFHTSDSRNRLPNALAPPVTAATGSPIRPRVRRKSQRTVPSGRSAVQPSVTGGSLNVAVLDDRAPLLLVQRHSLLERVYQVIRKQTSPDEHFSVSDGVEIDPELMWGTPRVLNDEGPKGALEVFAVVFLDEENPPVYDLADLPRGHAYALITYDPDAKLYCCEPVITPHHGSLACIKSPNIDEVIARTVAELDELLQKPWWKLEPWLSASWGLRPLLCVKAFFGSKKNWPRDSWGPPGAPDRPF